MRAGTRAALCVYVPYVLSASLEFLRAVARECGVHVCLHRIWCSAWAVVSCRVTVAWIFLWPGRYAGYCARDTMPPSPKGQQPASRRTGHSVPTSRAPMQKRSPRPLVLSPFGFCGSRRQWVVNPRTRVSGDLAVEDNQPSRQLALLEPRDHCRQPAPCPQKPLEPETTAGNQPRVYKSSWNPRPLQGNQPPCLQKFLVLSIEGNRPSSLEQDSLPETAAGQPAPASSKAVATQKLEHLGTTSPTVNHPSPFSNVKTELPFKACTA